SDLPTVLKLHICLEIRRDFVCEFQSVVDFPEIRLNQCSLLIREVSAIQERRFAIASAQRKRLVRRVGRTEYLVLPIDPLYTPIQFRIYISSVKKLYVGPWHMVVIGIRHFLLIDHILVRVHHIQTSGNMLKPSRRPDVDIRTTVVIPAV